MLAYSWNIKSLNDDPEKVYGVSQPLGVFNTRYNAPSGTADDDFTRPTENLAIESDMSLDEKQTTEYLYKQHKSFIQGKLYWSDLFAHEKMQKWIQKSNCDKAQMWFKIIQNYLRNHSLP